MSARVHKGLIVKLRPSGPWRSGPDSGARTRVDPIYHSDTLYGAVTSAMAALGMRDEWLDATARRAEGPAVRFSSLFPFLGDTAFVVPPRSIWPPAVRRERRQGSLEECTVRAAEFGFLNVERAAVA